ncbi:MAG: B12-binding domain-containing radical SAM protein [Acetobacteraceae bacterium]|nr:B12-binding domain-containing radical SAM protein [Acetobacteraceae bacterium]
MKVGLISPRGSVFGNSPGLARFLRETGEMETFRRLWTGPNLGLITLAAMLPEGWEAEYVDENYQAVDFDRGYDLVCLSSMTQPAPRAYAIAEEFRRRGVRTVMGGIHATVLPEEAAEHADTVVAGEAEELWPEFLADLLRGRPRRIYRSPRPGQVDLTRSPLPRFELLPRDVYPLITVQTTRGCPHDCSFCAASKVYGPRYRRKATAQIIRELEAVLAVRPGQMVLFADDNLLVMRSASKELLRAMIPLKLRWIGQSDISIARDEELLELLGLAGCQWVVIGFESVTREGLYSLDRDNWKLKQLQDYAWAIRTIQDHGIGVYGTFIVGLDSDDPGVFDRTFEFIVENNLYGVNVTVPTPLPGTRLFEQLAAEGRIINTDWSNYTLWDVNIRPRQMTVEELEAGLLRLYQRLYRPEYVQRRVRHFLGVVSRRPGVKGPPPVDSAPSGGA